jgi:transcriptional regulator with XRE-family HTH domain
MLHCESVPSVNVAFGRTIRALRENAGYSQEGFAHAIGIHRTYIGALERGQANPTLQTIVSIARGLRMSLAGLFQVVESWQGGGGQLVPPGQVASSSRPKGRRGGQATDGRVVRERLHRRYALRSGPGTCSAVFGTPYREYGVLRARVS